MQSIKLIEDTIANIQRSIYIDYGDGFVKLSKKDVSLLLVTVKELAQMRGGYKYEYMAKAVYNVNKALKVASISSDKVKVSIRDIRCIIWEINVRLEEGAYNHYTKGNRRIHVWKRM